jgi:hypothetical protein
MRSLSLLRSRLGLHEVVSALVLAVGFQQGLGQDRDGALQQRLVQEAPFRWEEYARLSGELQGVLSVSHAGTLNAYRYNSRMDYKTNGRGKTLKVATKDVRNGKVEQEDEEVFGFNPRYAFTLRRKSPSSPWILTDLLDLSSSTDLGRVAFRLNDYLACVSYAVRLDSEPLAEVLRKPAFRIGHCRKVERDGEELMEVTFTYSKEQANRKRRNLKGRLLFDPSRYWCLRSGDVEVTGDTLSGTRKIRVTQSDHAGESLPFFRVFEADGDWVSPAGWSNQQRIRYEVTLSQPTHLPPDEDFTLSAFGLPEPPGLEGRRPTPWYLWLGLAGIVCLALGISLRRRRQEGAKNA